MKSVLAIAGLALIAIAVATVAVADRAGEFAAVSISQLRDSDGKIAIRGRAVEIQGVVAADFRGPHQRGGIFVQQSATDRSGKPTGVFVALPAEQSCAVGDLVRIRGVADKVDGTVLIRPAATQTVVELKTLSRNVAPQPLVLTTASQTVDWNALSGTLVRFPYPLTVIDTYHLARYGQVTLAAERQFIPTNYIDPNDVQADGVSFDGDKNVSQIRSAEATHRRLRFVLDDGSNDQNPHQVFLQPDPEQGVKSLRVGSHIADLTGIVTVVDGQLQLLPVGTLSVHYEPRPPRAQIGQGNVTVASFNVLNFFTTIDDGRNGARGADSAVELDRQRQKLVAALLELDADIVGLMELENNQASEQDLVIALNNRLGSDQYSGSGLPAQFSTAPGGGPGGGNPIRVGIIYRHTRVQPVGPSGVVIDKAFSNARAPIVQTFQPVGGGSNLTVIVNHFKSKSPQEARGLDVDQRDGQAAFNDSRRRQSAALLHHMDQLRESGQAEHILIIGDLNAYSQEDPIDLLRSGGMIDLLQKFAGDQQPFSYVYKGQAGCLDHALATPELASLATGAAVWHINASEPRHTSYNVEFQPAGSYRGDAFRSSDHDPILIGFRL